ncbi:hypothetical protein [Lentzea kentuckyensis]|uniref:hypothetical protein n=1 Tax=Lentzea kentuckyensis TaxID=360086 RepID=UPI000A3AB1C1|nr:hypothetical protein [Lentzea kentuckyensis]
MRNLTALLLGCLLLTACAASSEHELRYKISGIDNSSPTEYLKLDLVDGAPKNALDPKALEHQLAYEREISGGAVVGDEVICTITQNKGSAFENSNVKTRLTGCKKA